jgi:hypothetical protein
MRVRFRIGILIVLLLFLSLPPVTGNTLHVGQSETYSTIQAAINAASAGDTILVDPGEYNERITISKSLTLNGATSGVGKNGYNVPAHYHYNKKKESIIAPLDTQSSPVVAIEKGDVTFDGFVVSMTVAGSYPQYAPTELIRMTAAGPLSNVKIQNNVIGPNTNTTLQNGNAGRMGITVSKWSPGTGDNIVYNLQIRNNKIFDAKGDGCGILMIGAKNTSAASLQNQFKGAVIDNNEITGNHRSGIDFSAGVQGGPAAADHIRITNNVISSNGWNSTIDRDNLKWGNGIVLIRMTDQVNDKVPWASRYIDIENNVFSDNEKNGIYIGPITRDVTITGNTIERNGRGASGGENGYSIWDGIRIDMDEAYQPPSNQQIYDYLTSIQISGNKIQDNGGFGIRVIQTPQNGPVDARRNWWGKATGPYNSTSNPSGDGDAVTGNVRFAPWYENTAMSSTRSPATGTGMTLSVSADNITGIQKAINAALVGDTVKVFPGSYDERIVINKSLALSGATSGISKKEYVVPAGYAYDATRESIIGPTQDQNEAVVKIETGSVTFDGFVVENTHANQYPAMTYPYTNLIALSNMSHDYSDVRIENNVIGPNTNINSQDGTKGRAGIALYGPSAATSWYLTIARNKIFDAKGDGCGILLLGSVNSTNQTMASSLGLTGKYRGSVIDSNDISGNHRSGIEFSGGVQGGPAAGDHFRITNNTISNNGWGSPSDRDKLKYGNGIVLIHVGSDKEWPYSWGSRYVDITSNRIFGNEKNGIYIGPINRDITISNNTIWNNGPGTGGYRTWDGVQVDLDESYHNPIYKNYAYLTNIVLKDNEINASGSYGVQVIRTPLSGAVDAHNNWWGEESGPYSAKNPTGNGNPVSDNVAFSPWYTNPGKTTLSQTLPKPMAAFSCSPSEIVKGESVACDSGESARLSSTSIQSYLWQFGDGDEITTTIPSATHTYNKPRVNTVTLKVTDSNGIFNTTTRQVTVIGKKDVIPLSFNGTSVSGEKGSQKITLDTSAINGTLTNTTTQVTVKNPGNGWAEMVVRGNTSGSSSGSITVQNISEVILKTAPSVTTLDTTPGGVGEVTTGIEISLKEYATAPLQVEVSGGANTTVSNAFQLAAGAGHNVDAVAYTMVIKGSDMINANLSASSEPVKLNMSVSEEWVNAHGGLSAIKVLRFSDDGNTKETLETNYLFTAGTPAMCYFEVISPHGCSIFGIASLSVVAPAAPAGSSNSGSSDSGYQGGRNAAKAGSTGSPPQKPGPQEFKAPLQETPVGRITETPSGATNGAQFQNKDETPPAPGSTTSQKDLTTRIKDFIVSYGIAIISILLIVIVCAGMLFWYRKKRRVDPLL